MKSILFWHDTCLHCYRAEENEKNIKIIEGLVDQKLREEEEYHQFREWLKDKSRKMRDPDVKADVRYSPGLSLT